MPGRSSPKMRSNGELSSGHTRFVSASLHHGAARAGARRAAARPVLRRLSPPRAARARPRPDPGTGAPALLPLALPPPDGGFPRRRPPPGVVVGRPGSADLVDAGDRLVDGAA